MTKERKRSMKRLLSGGLAMLLTVSMLTEPAAAVALQNSVPVSLAASRLDEVPEGNWVYFGTASATLEESNQYYTVPVYREGDLTEEASVELHTVDMTALYGKDYELVMPDVEETGTGSTILEDYMTAAIETEKVLRDDESIEETEDPSGETGEPSEETGEPSEETGEPSEETGEPSEETGEPSEETEDPSGETGEPSEEIGELFEETEKEKAFDNTDEDEESDATSVSSLAKWKEEVTGLPTRETYPTEVQDLMSSLAETLVPQAAAEVDYSSSFTLTFAPGEGEKWITFRLRDDSKSEGTENFSILLTNGVGVEPYTVTSLAVAISDDEPLVHSTVSFTKARYDSENGIATVAVERTGAEYSLVDMRIFTSEDTAKADINYDSMDETLTFLPYETEKEIDFYVGGGGDFTVLLDDFVGCYGGEHTKTKVHITAGDSAALVMSSADDVTSFDIQVYGKDYTVEYTPGQATGAILDKSVTPAVEVGVYYFALPTNKGGIFSYSTSQRGGHNVGRTIGVLDCEYVEKGTQHDSYGDVAYYAGIDWHDKGYVWTVTNKADIPAAYYRFIAPDWASFNSSGKRPQFRFGTHSFPDNHDYLWTDDLGYGKSALGKFDRKVDTSVALELKNIQSTETNRNIDLVALAMDMEGDFCPKAYLRFFGAAAMYKKYEVSVSTPGTMNFLTGTGASIAADPIQLYIRCGSQNLELASTDLKRYIYANPSEDDSNVVFSLNTSMVNGMYGKFATLTGYTITINSGDNRVTLNYPEDFISYLEKRSADTNWGETVAKYGSADIQKEIEKINANLSAVPFDLYFVDWIDSNQKAVVDSDSGYYQQLNFQPKYDYIDIPVTVLAPKNGQNASFTDEDLAAGRTYTYHAGDVLDLNSRYSADDGFRVTGYEVSTNKGVKWDSIRSTEFLKLDPNEVGSSGYYIRPLVEENDNCIEIKFADETSEKIGILGANYNGLVSDELLKAEGMDGSYILRLNDGDNAVEQMRPVPGEIYSIHFKPYTTTVFGNSRTYWPVITDSYGNTYTTQTLHYVARDSAADNVLTVSYLFYSSIFSTAGRPITFDVTGRLVSDYRPINPTGTETAHLSIEGYTVSMPRQTSGQQIDTVVDISDGDGTFTLTDVTGFSGRPMTMLVSNGSDKQVITVTPGSDDTLELGEIGLDYPDTAPTVRNNSVAYAYEKDANNMEADNIQNSVKIYDDTINITVTVDDKGHNVTQAEFTVYTLTGVETRYLVDADETRPGLFTCSIPQMAERLHNADRVRVALITEETITTTNAATGETETTVVEHRYPARDTGLEFYVESTAVIPKTIETTETPTMEIPYLGGLNSTAKSGLITFNKYYWDEQTRANYSMVLNVNAVLYQTAKNGTADNINEVEQTKQALKAMDSEFDELFFGLSDELVTESYMDSLYERLKQLRKEGATVPWGPGAVRSEYRDLNQYVYDCEEIIDSGVKTRGAETLSGFNSAKALQAQALLTLAFNFTFDPEQNAYIFTTGSVCIGGIVSYDKTWYTTVYGVPVYLNLGGYVSADMAMLYRTRNADTAMTANMFDQISGNMIGQLSGDESIQCNLNVGGKIKVSAGVGLCGVLGAKGSLALEMMFLVPLSEDIVSEYGVLIVGSGGIGIDLLITSLELEMVKAAYGAGAYKNMSSVSFIGGLLEVDLKSETARTATLRSSSSGFVTRDYDLGTSDMSGFGSNGFVRATPEEIQRTILLDEAAERTAPQIVELDDGRQMIFFIGNRDGESALNSRALFWSVCENGWWSEPQIVADDGTADASPVALQKNGKVVLAWVDADRPYAEEDTIKDKLNAFGISMAVYEDGEMSDEVTLVEDEFFNFAPQLNLVGDTLHLNYMKRDISEVTMVEDLLDFTGLYSTMAYVEIDVPSRTKIDEGAVVVEHDVLTDPLVMDYQCVAAKVGGEDYMVATYTVDEDENLNTSADRELFLSITNLNTDQTYYPIALTSDQVDQSNPQLTDLDGTVYLTWFERGYLFSMMDVTELLGAFFDTEAVGDAYRDDTGKDWYRKSADELPGILPGDGSGADEDSNVPYYDGTFYDLANRGVFRYEQTNFQASDNMNTSISDYVLTTDGDDIYIFFTDFGSDEFTDLSKELYGVRYQRDMEQDDKAEAWGFGKAVKITNYGRVIDEFDLYMTPDNKISMVSNHYKHWINDNGVACQSSNQLVEIEFAPASSLAIVDERVSLPGYYVSGNTEDVTFEVLNDGLLTSTGFDVTLSEVKGGAETVIYQESYDIELDSGESCEIRIPWTIPADLSDMQIKVTVTEHDVDISRPAKAFADVPYEVSLSTSGSTIKWEDGKAVYTTTVTNLGNKPSEAAVIRFGPVEEGEMIRISGEADLPALASGESTEVMFTYLPEADDFNGVGSVNLQLNFEQGETHLRLDAVPCYSAKPVVAEINQGVRSLTLEMAKTTQLTAEAAPWDGIAGDVRWTSSDPAVASVDGEGTVTGHFTGTATITAYFECGISDSIEVVVTQSASEDSDSEDSDSDDSTPAYGATVDDTENGMVTVAPKYAEKGETVTIHVSPDKGYTLETLTVTDKNGDHVELTKVSNTKYTFKMPASNVTVKATFMDDNTMLNFFVDVPADAYYYDAVLWAVKGGITNGTSATTFSPDNPCTRAQMATFLWRAAGSPEPAGTPHPFTDIPADAYYAKAVQWAYEKGITGGTSATTYSPDEACTRGQMATFLWRNTGSQAPASSANQFTDVPADKYYAAAVQWAYEQKITAGTSATTFSPNDLCTRAQMVTFLYRYFVK